MPGTRPRQPWPTPALPPGLFLQHPWSPPQLHICTSAAPEGAPAPLCLLTCPRQTPVGPPRCSRSPPSSGHTHPRPGCHRQPSWSVRGSEPQGPPSGKAAAYADRQHGCHTTAGLAMLAGATTCFFGGSSLPHLLLTDTPDRVTPPHKRHLALQRGLAPWMVLPCEGVTLPGPPHL